MTDARQNTKNKPGTGLSPSGKRVCCACCMVEKFSEVWQAGMVPWCPFCYWEETLLVQEQLKCVGGGGIYSLAFLRS